MSDTLMIPTVGTFPGVMGPHTQRAVEKLRDGKPGDIIDRPAMTMIVGRECTPGALGYGNVSTAIKHVERHYAIVWRWIKSDKAWRCLTEEEKMTVEHGYTKQSRRCARRGMVVGQSIDVAQLSSDQKRVHSVNQSVAGMIYLCVGGAFRKKLKAVESTLREPEQEKLVELMKTE